MSFKNKAIILFTREDLLIKIDLSKTHSKIGYIPFFFLSGEQTFMILKRKEVGVSTCCNVHVHL